MTDNKCVHTEHCCVMHGCKYFDEDCPVVSGHKEQSYFCEDCSHDGQYFPWSLPDWAIGVSNGELQVGVQLCTKDGRRMGNAVVIQEHIETFTTGGKYKIYDCITDMGNKITLTESEIEECFYIGDYIMDVEAAVSERERSDSWV